jgi:FKBP-type peptidyl-prolyl cis-trans isomerase
MKTKLLAGLIVVAACVSLFIFAADDEKEQNEELKDNAQKLSYAYGMSIANQLKQMGSAIDTELVMRGIRDSLENKKPLISKEEAAAVIDEFAKKQESEVKKRMNEVGQKNKVEGEAFLKENKGKKDVVTTKSGLQYMVLKKSTGEKPKETSTVKVHYKGTLLNGKTFDSSYDRNQPAVFPLNRVIRGWTEGLQLMNVGSTFKFFIPSELAYGDRGMGNDIGPNAVLIFEVELLSIEK